MNQKRAKKLRRAVRTLKMDTVPRYDQVVFNRKYFYREYNADGTYEMKESTYPVRTLYLVKCERAVYRRLKRKPYHVQEDIMRLMFEAEQIEQQERAHVA